MSLVGFQDFIKRSNATLTIFDVDETLFNTHALIYVLRDGKVIHKLNNQQFNTYQLQPGEQFDFREFRSAKKFAETSKPIAKMVNKLKAIQAHVRKTPLNRTIIVTARSDFDNKRKLVDFFQSHGIDIDNEIYVERSGNLGGSTAGNKKVTFQKYLDTGVYKRVRLYDDAKGNLDALLSLKDQYPDVQFEAWLVDGHTGNIKRYTR